MQFIIVTGMSGAGKSTALNFLEDGGYFCVDNLPPALIGKFAEICYGPDSGLTKVALGVDVRGGSHFEDLFDQVDQLRDLGANIDILFLESSDEILVKRYKETRRKHPLVMDGRIQDGIIMEREILEPLKTHANYIIETTNLLTRELKKRDEQNNGR